MRECGGGGGGGGGGGVFVVVWNGSFYCSSVFCWG